MQLFTSLLLSLPKALPTPMPPSIYISWSKNMEPERVSTRCRIHEPYNMEVFLCAMPMFPFCSNFTFEKADTHIFRHNGGQLPEVPSTPLDGAEASLLPEVC